MSVGERARIAVLPGSFDPPTLGHLDILLRGLEVFDEVIVAILDNSSKSALFTTKEREEMILEAVGDRKGVRVEIFGGLLVDFVVARDARVILRGIRAVSDFEYEYQMALMNRKLNPNVETVVMMASEEYSYVSSRLVKEVASLGGALSGVVPPNVQKHLEARYPRRNS